MSNKVLWRFVLAFFFILSFSLASCTPNTLPKVYTEPELKYRLIDYFGNVFWCDPDYYPLGSLEREIENALVQFTTIKTYAEEFAAILKRLILDNKERYTNEEKLLVYRQHKLLTYAATLSGISRGYEFSLRIGEGQGESIEGTINATGNIKVTKREPSINTCPICLAMGTLIDTPDGSIPVEEMHVGMEIWTLNASGNRIVVAILKITKTPVPVYFKILEVVLSDGRTISASPGHPTAEGKTLSKYTVGEELDGAMIISIEYNNYTIGTTYDILPSGDTSLYWANGILLGSTLTN